MSTSDLPGQTCYELLQVHPAAPLELVTAAYWRLVGQAQAKRATDPSAETLLHQLNRAYQTLADPGQRRHYDAALGIGEQDAAPIVPRRKQGLLDRALHRQVASQVDYYEILRVAPEADSSILSEAYVTLRAYYLRLINTGQAGDELIDALEEAHSVTSDPRRRRIYDEDRRRWLEQTRFLEQSGGGRRGGHPAVPPLPGPLLKPELAASPAAANPSPPASMKLDPGSRLAQPEDGPDVRRVGVSAETASVAESLDGTKTADPVSRDRLSVDPLTNRPLPGSADESAAGLLHQRRSVRTEPDQANVPTREHGETDSGVPGQSFLASTPLEPSLSSSEPAGAEAVLEPTKRAAAMLTEPPQEFEALPFTPVVDDSAQSTTDQNPVSDQVKDTGQSAEPGFRRDDEDIPDVALLAGGTITNGVPRRSSVRLEVVGGPSNGSNYQLERFPIEIGSSEKCEVALGSLQPRQARLIHRNGMFVITNTEVSDDPSSKAWMILQDGDEFQLGPHKLRFSVVSG